MCAREHDVCSPVGEGVEHTPVGGVRHTERDLRTVGRERNELLGHEIDPVGVVVRVVDAEGGDARVAEGQHRGVVVEAGPAELCLEVVVERPVSSLSGRIGRFEGPVR